MKTLLAAAVLASTTALAGAAMANDTLDATFGNTVTVTAEDGTVVASYLMNEGNTYEMVTAEGTIGGSWRLSDEGQICLSPTGGEETCNDLPEGMNVGDSWTVDGDEGAALTVAIVEGR